MEGKAAVQRDLSKLETWFGRNLVGFRPKLSSASGKEPLRVMLQTGDQAALVKPWPGLRDMVKVLCLALLKLHLE